MPRSDLLINLVKSGASGDKMALRKTVEAIVAEERAKQHNVVADRIEKAYSSANGHGGSAPMGAVLPEQGSRARDFIAEVTPRRRLEDLILPDVTALSVQQLIEEQQRASLLRSHSLEPRHSALLVGPPGNGKTDKTIVRGTIFHERRTGERAAAFVDNSEVLLRVSCRATAGELDEAVPYALAISFEAGIAAGIPVYEEIRARIAPRVGVGTGMGR